MQKLKRLKICIFLLFWTIFLAFTTELAPFATLKHCHACGTNFHHIFTPATLQHRSIAGTSTELCS